LVTEGQQLIGKRRPMLDCSHLESRGISAKEMTGELVFFVYHRARFPPMNPDDLNLDQRLSRFEAQLDRFSLALQQWHQQARISPPAAAAPDVDQRIRTIEETLDRETAALRRLHEEPLKELQAHVAALKEICVAAATSVRSLDHSESRLSAIQSDVHTHLGELSRALQILVADLRVSTSTALSAQGPAAAWPLERIVHLHDELRRTGDRGGATAVGDAPPGPGVSFSAHGGSDIDVSSAEAAGAIREHDSATISRRMWLAGIAAFAVLAIIVFLLEQRIERRLNDAGERVTAAERQAAAATQLANQQIVVARDDANRQIAQARDSALRAETVGAILTAPDLIRFNLMSPSVDRSSAQVLWSRTRGVVLSASRLPAAPPNTSYQLWLKTSTQSVSAGVFVPDANGRATLVTDVPPKVVGAVLGAEVTLEQSGGAAVPSGRTTLLVRYPPG
jgi:hypothetical protein